MFETTNQMGFIILRHSTFMNVKPGMMTRGWFNGVSLQQQVGHHLLNTWKVKCNRVLRWSYPIYIGISGHVDPEFQCISQKKNNIPGLGFTPFHSSIIRRTMELTMSDHRSTPLHRAWVFRGLGRQAVNSVLFHIVCPTCCHFLCGLSISSTLNLWGNPSYHLWGLLYINSYLDWTFGISIFS